jgi:hypothetical protein
MTKLTRSNYEIFFIDYFDGKLDKFAEKELFHFLNLHPDLKEEFENYNREIIKPESTVKYFGKDRLKKNTITIYNYKTYFISYHEGDLNAEQKKEVDLYVSQNENLRSEFEILLNVRFQAEKEIVFTNKKNLRKGNVISIKPVYKYVSVAAAIIIFMIGYFMFRNIIEPENSFTEIKIDKSEEIPSGKDQTGPSNVTVNDSVIPNRIHESEPLATVNQHRKSKLKIVTSKNQEEEILVEDATEEYHLTFPTADKDETNDSSSSNQMAIDNSLPQLQLQQIKLSQNNLNDNRMCNQY